MQTVSHYSHDEAHTIIADALALVEAVEAPEDLREMVFGKAVDLLSARQVFIDPSELRAISVADQAISRAMRRQ